MRVFVAGATGVVGAQLVPQLLRAGHQVTAMTRAADRAARLAAAGAHPVVCDVFDAAGVRAAVAGADAVIHQLTALPARLDRNDPHAFDATNRVRTEGTRILVEAAGGRPVIAQSIAFAYAPAGDLVKTEDAPLYTDAPPPFGAVVAAVAELERRVLAAGGAVLRYGTLYGPGTYYDRHGSVGADIRAGRVPVVPGATGLYSWLHVEDAASAAVAALERGATGIYNIVDDEPAPQPEWLPVLAAALGGPAPAEAPAAPGNPVLWQRGASNAKAKRELAWRPRYASWREGFSAGT